MPKLGYHAPRVGSNTFRAPRPMPLQPAASRRRLTRRVGRVRIGVPSPVSRRRAGLCETRCREEGFAEGSTDPPSAGRRRSNLMCWSWHPHDAHSAGRTGRQRPGSTVCERDEVTRRLESLQFGLMRWMTRWRIIVPPWVDGCHRGKCRDRTSRTPSRQAGSTSPMAVDTRAKTLARSID